MEGTEKLLFLWNLNLEGTLKNILCDEWEVCIKHFSCIPMGFHITEQGKFRPGFRFHTATNLHETTTCQRSIQEEYP